MSVRKKSEKAVPALLDRLSKAKDHALQVHATAVADQDQNHNHESITSKFDDIESKLKLLTHSLSKMKNWEKKVVVQFCALEQVLDDEIFTSKDPEMESQVHDKLTHIEDDVVKLEELISKLTLIEEDVDDHDHDHGHDHRPPHHHHHHTVSYSQKWGELGVELRISKSDAISALSACFHSLNNSRSGDIKTCLLSLSVFPENTPIKKRPLVYWWIGEGFVANTRNATAEEAGEQVLQELLSEGFIKPASTTTITGNSFLLHPWIRLMLIQIAQRNNFIQFNPKGLTPCNGNRRSFLRRGGDGTDSMNNGERVEDPLTVFNVDEQYLGIRSEWLSKLHKVEVLQMGRWQDSVTHHIELEDYKELFKGLGSQKHLKHLSLRGISRIETLPKSIKKLLSLQILDLRACHNLEELPQEVTELMNLTHLDVSECYLVERMPKGLERLSKLQVLKGFVAGSPSRNSCKLSDLARLLHLRKLSIRVRDVGSEQLDTLVNLSPALRILTISWGVVTVSPMLATVNILPASLTKLDLRSVPLEAVPVWLQPEELPPNVEKLYVKGGKLKLDNIERLTYSNTVKVKRFEYLSRT